MGAGSFLIIKNSKISWYNRKYFLTILVIFSGHWPVLNTFYILNIN